MTLLPGGRGGCAPRIAPPLRRLGLADIASHVIPRTLSQRFLSCTATCDVASNISRALCRGSPLPGTGSLGASAGGQLGGGQLLGAPGAALPFGAGGLPFSPSVLPLGRAVQVEPVKHMLKPPGTKHLQLKCDILLSTFAFSFNLRRYS
jgi:hypothetical protein